MTITSHKVAPTETFVRSAAITPDARAVFDELLTARLSPAIAYDPRAGFAITLPSGLSDSELADELASAEERIAIEVSDLLDDGGLVQELEVRYPS